MSDLHRERKAEFRSAVATEVPNIESACVDLV
jgi:hypothetical protein